MNHPVRQPHSGREKIRSWTLFAGTPRCLIERWASEFAEPDRHAEYRRRFAELDVEPEQRAGGELARYIDAERAKWWPSSPPPGRVSSGRHG